MQKISAKSQYINGLRAGIPVMLGFVPVGIAYALMARQAGFSIFKTCLMSLSVFAGASQMMAVGMYTQGAGIITIIIATFMLNLRHLIMSVCVYNRMPKTKMKIKLLTAFGVTDESFAIFTTEKQENCTTPFFFGLITATYLSWNLGTLAGALANDLLPPIVTASLGVSLYAMFIGLLFPDLSKNLKLAALVLLTAVCNTVLTQFIASSWALIISTLLCAFIGVFFVDIDKDTSDIKTEDGRQ